MITQRKVPFKPRAPHIDGWLNREEVRRVVAASNPYAPKNYQINNLIVQADKGKLNIRYMHSGRYQYVCESDLHESLKIHPIYKKPKSSNRKSANRVPHLDEYLTTLEASELIAKSNPHAPKNYRVIQMLKTKTHGHIRTFKERGYIYIHESDLRESIKENPIYAGKKQSPTCKSLLTCIFHNYVDNLPEGEDDWVTVNEAARITGAKKSRIYNLAKILSIKCLIYKNRIHVRLSKAMERLVLRQSNFIKRLGLNPDDYPIVESFMTKDVNAMIHIHYAPDLIGK